MIHTVAIIGLGQMGASLGLALKRGGMVSTIGGYDLHPDHSATALSLGAIDTLHPTLATAVAAADCIILCTPVGSYGAIAQTMRPHLKPEALITDIGSIKAQALRDVTPHLPPGCLFIPSHPIAGSEKVGPAHARPDFFARRLFLITPPEGAPEEPVRRVAQLWQSTGAAVEIMPAELHDHVYAYMSHLPQLIAFAAMPVLGSLPVATHSELFTRFIRIGRSDPEMWRDVMLENAAYLLPAAATLERTLEHMVEELRSGEPAAAAPNDVQRLATGSLPRLLASALIMAVQLAETQMERKLARYAAGGFIDVSCPATENPDGDFAFVSQHAHTLADFLSAYLQEHRAISQAIETADAAGLLARLAIAQAAGKRLVAPSLKP